MDVYDRPQRGFARRLWRTLWVLALTAGALWALCATVWAADTTVKSLHTDCTVAQDGSCDVVLTAEISFADGTQSFAIPVSAQGKNVSVSGYTFTRERAGDYTMLNLQSETGFSGERQLVISYHLAETVLDKGDSQDFAVTLLYPAWPCAIERYDIMVTLPGSFEGFPTILSGYYGDLIDNYMDVQIRDGVITAVLNEKQTLQDHESMSLSLTLPEGFFDLRFLAGKTAPVDRLLFWMFLLLGLLYWAVFIRSRLVLASRQTMPPMGMGAGAVGYALTQSKADLALMLVEWAGLGYLTIHRTRKGRLFVQRQIDMGNERKPYEVAIFQTLFQRKDDCDVRSAEFQRAKDMAPVKTGDYYKDRLFSPRSGMPALLRLAGVLGGMALALAMLDVYLPPKSWRWFAIVPLTLLAGLSCMGLQQIGGASLKRHFLRSLLLALPCPIFYLVFARFTGDGKLAFACVAYQILVGELLRLGGRRTRNGTSIAAELLGFRKYLATASLQTLQANLASDPQYYYKTLPYADALQVARLFTGTLDKTRLESCDWLVWEGKTPKTAPGFYARYLRLMAGLRGERPPRR